jgi:Holliday junction resolvase RusA-like endonuclease
MVALETTIPGRPEAKGSLRVGKHGQMFSANPRLKAWQERVALKVAESRGSRPPLEGPVAIVADFCFGRPPSHSLKSGRLRKGAPLAPGRPDLDKLVRGLLDALTGVLFKDDSQVCELDVSKRYYETPGVVLYVSEPDLRQEVEA